MEVGVYPHVKFSSRAMAPRIGRRPRPPCARRHALHEPHRMLVRDGLTALTALTANEPGYSKERLGLLYVKKQEARGR
jgi:hypothetical protein